MGVAYSEKKRKKKYHSNVIKSDLMKSRLRRTYGESKLTNKNKTIYTQ